MAGRSNSPLKGVFRREVDLITLTPQFLILIMAAILFLLGAVTFIIGVLTLTLRASSSDVKTLAVQTSKLAQKGLVDDMSGLVGNASSLLDAMDQLVRTNRGTGIFLTISGALLMGFASWLAIRVYS